MRREYSVYDAVGEPMLLNRYSYVAGNPINFVDPSGMIMESPWEWDNCLRQQSHTLRQQPTPPIPGSDLVLQTAVVIAGGHYHEHVPENMMEWLCTPEQEVICGRKTCMGAGVHLGLGTLIENGFVISHDHYAEPPNTADQAVQQIKARGFQWVEFRGASGTIHVPIDKLTAGAYGNTPTAAFYLGDKCDLSTIGTPAPLRTGGVKVPKLVSQIQDWGAPLLYVYISGPNPGIVSPLPNANDVREVSWEQLAVGYAWYEEYDPQGYMYFALDSSVPEEADFGDSGGGAFILIAGRFLYYLGPLQRKSVSSSSSLPQVGVSSVDMSVVN